MKELSIIQTDDVTGGVALVPGVFIGWAAGHVLDHLAESYHDYWKNAVDSGWGSNPGTPPPNAGFGTI